MKKSLIILFVTVIGISLSAQKADLKFQLENNKTYRLQTTQVDNKTTTMQGMSQNTETTTNTVFSIKPINQTPDFFIAQVKFDSFNIHVNVPPMNITSKDEGDISSNNPVDVITAIIHRLCNSEFVVKFDYSGKVLEMINYDMVTQNILLGTEDLTGQTKMIVDMQGKTLVSKDMLSGMIESSFHYLPGKEVKKGENWITDINVSSGGLGSKVTTDYKLVAIEGNIATIEGKSTIVPASDEPVDMNGTFITSQIKGMGKINFTIDLNTGMMVEGTSEIQMSGNMLVNAQGNSMEIPIESISEATIKGL